MFFLKKYHGPVEKGTKNIDTVFCMLLLIALKSHFGNMKLKFRVVNLAIVIGIGLCNHFFDLVVRKFFPEMHHTMFEFIFADESIAIAIENSANKMQN